LRKNKNKYSKIIESYQLWIGGFIVDTIDKRRLKIMRYIYDVDDKQIPFYIFCKKNFLVIPNYHEIFINLDLNLDIFPNDLEISIDLYKNKKYTHDTIRYFMMFGSPIKSFK